MGTPVKIAFFTVLITQALAVVAWPLGLEQAGLTLATSIGALLQRRDCLLLFLRRKRLLPAAARVAAHSSRSSCVASSCSPRRCVVASMGVGATWLTAGVVAEGRAGSALVIAAGAVVYFGTLYALGFRLAQFNRRDAIEPP